MKTKITILIIVGILLTSCGAETAAQETEVVTETPIEVPVNEVAMMQESAVTESPTATDTPTKAPTAATPLACVNLLEPVNGSNLPVTGKVTFSWTPMDEAGRYILNFILPSGQTVAFETEQTFRERYMEAFVSGGEYQWQVIVLGIDGSKICASEVAAFNKPANEQSQKPEDGGNDDGNGNGQPPEEPPGPPGSGNE